jgi:hypothetical protein
MGGAALASVLHIAGHPLPSHCCHPIVVIQLLSSNCRPQITTVIFIDIVIVGSGSGIIAIAITITVAVTVFAIAVVAVIIDVALLMLLCHCCCCCAPWQPIGGA